MERRKFMIGVGSLAAGGAAAIGSGAFSSAQADRSFSVNVTGDSAGYMALEPGEQNDEHAEMVEGELVLKFDSDDGAGGSGVNNDSEFYFDDVFRVTNQGTQTIYLAVTIADFGGGNGESGEAAETWGGTNLDTHAYWGEARNAKINGDANVVEIPAGETEHIGVGIRANENEPKYKEGSNEGDEVTVRGEEDLNEYDTNPNVLSS